MIELQENQRLKWVGSNLSPAMVHMFQINSRHYTGLNKSLPYTYKVGEWMPEERAVVCSSGYHVVAPYNPFSLIYWASSSLWVVDVEGDCDQMSSGNNSEDKECWSRMRLVEQVDFDAQRALRAVSLSWNGYTGYWTHDSVQKMRYDLAFAPPDIYERAFSYIVDKLGPRWAPDQKELRQAYPGPAELLRRVGAETL